MTITSPFRALIPWGLFLFLSTGCAKSSRPAEYFPVTPGLRWYYMADGERLILHEVLSGEGTEALLSVVFDQLPLRRDHYVRDASGVLLAKRELLAGTVRFDPPQPVLRWPLEPGQEWTWSGKMGKVSAEVRYRVEGIEAVTIPEGTHQALKIHLSGASSGGETYEHTRWYVPGKGLVKEHGRTVIEGAVREQTLELLRFRPDVTERAR